MNKIGLMIGCLLAMGGFDPAHAFRCGGALVSVGDPKAEVRADCGDPTEVTDWVEYRVVQVYHSYLDIFEAVEKPIFVEEWIYNLGPHRFIRKLRFENGHLEDIDSLLDIFEAVEKPIFVEEWIYNLGPHRFIRKLRFENGHLEDIDSLGYGY